MSASRLGYSRKALLLSLAVLGVLCAIAIALWRIRGTTESFWATVSDEYAVQEVVEMIELSTIENGGELPTSWDDLQEVYSEVDQSYGRGLAGFQLLKSKVSIDFAAMDVAAKGFAAQSITAPISSAPFIRCLTGTSQNTELTPFEKSANQQLERFLRAISEKMEYERR